MARRWGVERQRVYEVSGPLVSSHQVKSAEKLTVLSPDGANSYYIYIDPNRGCISVSFRPAEVELRRGNLPYPPNPFYNNQARQDVCLHRAGVYVAGPPTTESMFDPNLIRISVAFRTQIKTPLFSITI